jgi:hypothetical protein
MIAYLVLAPLGEALKIFMLVQVAVGPGQMLFSFIYMEALIIGIVDLFICISMIIVGLLLKLHFGVGLKKLMQKKVDSLKKPII